MSELIPFAGVSTFIYQAVLDRLEDLAQFGVHLYPTVPTHKCVCGAYVGMPWNPGQRFDNLCEPCYNREGGKSFYDRIYTNRTVYVSDPIITESSVSYVDNNGFSRPIPYSSLYGLVVIDKQLCLLSATLAYVEGKGWGGGRNASDLCDLNTGERVLRRVFTLDYYRLDELRQTQAPL